MIETFQPGTIDDSPALLEKSYRLRYDAYCVERRFLDPADYPDHLERDRFDPHSIHVGVLDSEGELVGTARIVKPSSAGLPALQRCTLFPHETSVTDPDSLLVEISRVCISRRYTRRRADQPLGMPDAVEPEAQMAPLHERRHDGDDLFGTLIKALYHASKRLGATHWIVAIEKPLRRRIAQYGLPFELAGPEVDYYGLVEPHIMSIAELDQVILDRQFPALDDFLVGLEAELQPHRVTGTTVHHRSHTSGPA